MQDDEPLTADQCDELSRALREDAQSYQAGVKRKIC